MPTDAASAISAASDEVPFEIGDLFFSRTDERGIILSGNAVFQRISMYDWPELLGKPHKIIRHPETPRAVFHLLWDFLKAGKPIGAYVKNRAKDGRHYWVFALASPVAGGYLSVRLKPTSAVFGLVRDVYADILDHERRQQPRPADSAALLLERLKALGFPSYDSFMSAALAAELSARDAAMSRRPDTILTRLGRLQAASSALEAEAEEVALLHDTYKYVPLNLRVLAAQLGSHGSAVGVISGDYGEVSDQISAQVTAIATSVGHLIAETREGTFLMGAASLQQEVHAVFVAENKAEGETALTDRSLDLRHLEELAIDYRRRTNRGLATIGAQVARFTDVCADARKLALGLEVIRLMAKLNAASLPEINATLEGLLGDLAVFQRALSDRLDRIQRANAELRHEIDLVLADVRQAA